MKEEENAQLFSLEVGKKSFFLFLFFFFYHYYLFIFVVFCEFGEEGFHKKSDFKRSEAHPVQCLRVDVNNLLRLNWGVW